MRRFVLTGGHGVGKSSIILALEQAGEHVVFEAASSVRALARAEGRPFAEDSPTFESEALALHLHRERLVPPSTARVFLDRGALDHLAYSQVGRWPLNPGEIAACRSSHYEVAFLVEAPPDGVPTLDRVEARFSQRLAQAIEEVYQAAAIPIIRVPYGRCHERARFILNTLNGGPLG
jgi:predicted ATPase